MENNQQENSDKQIKIDESQEEVIDVKIITNEVNLRVWSEDIKTEPKVIKRLTFTSLLIDLAGVFNLDKGLFYTLKGLTIRPAQTIREYLDDGRYKVMNPIKYFIVIFSITFLIGSQNNYFDIELRNMIEDSEQKVGEDEGKKKEIIDELTYQYENYFSKYENIWTLLTTFFFSFFAYLFFKKAGYNFVEHNVISAYVFIHTYLLFTLMIIFQLHDEIWEDLSSLTTLIMAIIVFKHLFQISWWNAFWKSTLAYLVSTIILYTIAVIFIFLMVWSKKGFI